MNKVEIPRILPPIIGVIDKDLHMFRYPLRLDVGQISSNNMGFGEMIGKVITHMLV